MWNTGNVLCYSTAADAPQNSGGAHARFAAYDSPAVSPTQGSDYKVRHPESLSRNPTPTQGRYVSGGDIAAGRGAKTQAYAGLPDLCSAQPRDGDEDQEIDSDEADCGDNEDEDIDDLIAKNSAQLQQLQRLMGASGLSQARQSMR